METFLDFFSLQDPNIRYVLAGTILLGISAGALGCFAILRRRALVGDAVAHAVLPGVCLAFIVAGGKDPVLLVIGSFIFGLLSMVIMDFISRNSRIAPDASIGMVLSVFFGFGIVLLTFIQSAGYIDQSGLDDFLFGQAAAMLRSDVEVFGGLSILIIFLIWLVFKELKLVSFDPSFAKSIGYPLKRIEFLIALLMVMTITAGIQAVGVVLMASMLIIPAAAARYWTDSLRTMIVIAATIGAFSGVTGSFISYTLPAMPTGPWMVVTAAAIFFISFLGAPKRGEITHYLNKNKFSRKINSENILKNLYIIQEKGAPSHSFHTLSILSGRLKLSKQKLKKYLSSLINKGYILETDHPQHSYKLTTDGTREARRLVRVHRLWEQYLNQQLQIPKDHVHDDAESMEHLITPEIEKELKDFLGTPHYDPHQSLIPYDHPEKEKKKDIKGKRDVSETKSSRSK